ncbi:hypothetical protein ACFQ21_13580 [Ohtaekwangia kribbensis]|uniref:TonB C-terminal domain-containing protein n=1 Tax=Ohtaekwangia kribbensis TaxID=688913 RepID=A0ABW3K552_9BACT
MNNFIKILLLLLISQVTEGQISIELLNTYNNPGPPELYFKYKLQDTIFAKHEGLQLKNFASVKFDIDKNGVIDNVHFSISTDSLLHPYIMDVLMSTNHHWIIKQKGKSIKKKITVILPMIFTLTPRVTKKTTTRVEEHFGDTFEDIELEATHLFQFNKKDYSLYMFYRNVEKYNGVVLNPIEVRVPNNPDENNY